MRPTPSQNTNFTALVDSVRPLDWTGSASSITLDYPTDGIFTASCCLIANNEAIPMISQRGPNIAECKLRLKPPQRSGSNCPWGPSQHPYATFSKSC